MQITIESRGADDFERLSELEWLECHPEADAHCYSDDIDCDCGRPRA